MLNRIALFNFVVSLIAFTLLRHYIAPLDRALSTMPETGEFVGVKLSVGTILSATFVAVFCRAIKFHELISDVFRVRKNFDVTEILIPMAERTIGKPLSAGFIARLDREREKLMGKVFYQYASSSKDKAVIDPHLIENALDRWSWFWCLSEATTVLLASAVALVVFGRNTPGFILIGVIVLCDAHDLDAPPVWQQCGHRS